MSNRHIPVDIDTAKSLIGEGIHTGMRKAIDSPQAHPAWKAIQELPDDDWDAVLEFLVSGLASVGYELFEVQPDFECPSYISHGPGHQSRTKCESRTPHPIEGDHWARDPMCPGFEWAGPKASTGF